MKLKTMVFAALAALCTTGGAEAACSAATLAGNWGIRTFTVYQGSLGANAAVYAFNGTTNRFTASGAGSNSGYSPRSATASGSFSISSSCLGNLAGTFNDGSSFTARFVVTEFGRTVEGESQSASKITSTFTGHKL